MRLLHSNLTAGALVMAITAAVYGQEKPMESTQDANANKASTPPANQAARPAAFRIEGNDLHIGNLPPVTFHGFLSQGLLYSGDYDYLGHSTKGELRFTELGINAAFNPFPRTRVAVQGFLFKVGDQGSYEEPMLDYASLEYTFSDKFGVRAGRVRKPNGIYNHIQDVDLARTFVLLPQGIYDARWRDFSSSIDGGEFFGTIPLQKAGSLNYEVYGGLISLSDNGGVAGQLRNGLSAGGKLDEMSQPVTAGVQLWWNTPLDGFRAGLSYAHAFGVDFNITQPVPPFGTVFRDSSIDVDNVRASVEYLWKG